MSASTCLPGVQSIGISVRHKISLDIKKNSLAFNLLIANALKLGSRLRPALCLSVSLGRFRKTSHNGFDCQNWRENGHKTNFPVWNERKRQKALVDRGVCVSLTAGWTQPFLTEELFTPGQLAGLVRFLDPLAPDY